MITDVKGRESVRSHDREDLLVRTPRHRSPDMSRRALLWSARVMCDWRRSGEEA
jgi:hypothetical protein